MHTLLTRGGLSAQKRGARAFFISPFALAGISAKVWAMMNGLKIVCVGLVFFTVTTFPTTAQESGKVRSWTNAEGRSIKAILLHITEKSAMLKLANGKTATVPLTSLSKEDQTLIAKMVREKLVLPPPMDLATASPDQLHFSLNGLGKPGPKFMQRLENIYTVAGALPFGLAPKPGPDQNQFVVNLVDSAGYRSLLQSKKMNPGLKPNAAFLLDDVALYVNYSNIRADKMTPLKQAEIDHETANLILMRWKYVLPAWLADGLAGCVASIPVANGAVQMADHEAGMKQFVATRFGGDPAAGVTVTSPVALLAMKSGGWSPSAKNRMGAMMLTYFFMHLDGATAPGVSLAQMLASVDAVRGDTVGLLRTFQGAQADYEKKRVLFNKQVEEYNEAVNGYGALVAAYTERVKQFNAQAKSGVPEDQRIKVGERPTEPKKPVAPVMPAILREDGDGSDSDAGAADLFADALEKAMPMLLKGRSGEDIAEQMKAGFAKIGVPVVYGE